MIWAVRFTQPLDPFGWAPLSTLCAAVPVLVLFYGLVVRGWSAPKAGLWGGLTAIGMAAVAFGMPVDMAVLAFFNGALFGLLPIGWTVFAAMLVYNLTVEGGQFAVIRRSVAALSDDARIQAVLIGFAFGAFLEGAAGAGSPVAICGAMLVGLGFPPLKAAVLCLLANTSPVAFGGLGVPILTLAGVTDIPVERISVMAARQLPFMSLLIPLYMAVVMCGLRNALAVWPALAVAGGSFAAFQYLCGTIHLTIPSLVLFPVTDIGGGIFALVMSALFLRVWKPKKSWHYREMPKEEGVPLTPMVVARAWAPFAIMSLCLLAAGFVRQAETDCTRAKEPMPVVLGDLRTRYQTTIDGLDRETIRHERLRKQLPDGSTDDAPERATWDIIWISAPGTPVFLSAMVSVLVLGIRRREVGRAFRTTVRQMRIPIPTICCMLGLSYVTRYSGMDAVLGIAFAGTGVLYPFFAAMLGWLGVFLTGTDAGSNALFGSLQKITATEVYHQYEHTAFQHLTLDEAQTLICTANSTGGVMGKMIDAQSICVATAGTDQVGKEGIIFRAVLGHSIALAAVIGLMTLAQAYLYPFTRMVP